MSSRRVTPNKRAAIRAALRQFGGNKREVMRATRSGWGTVRDVAMEPAGEPGGDGASLEPVRETEQMAHLLGTVEEGPPAVEAETPVDPIEAERSKIDTRRDRHREQDLIKQIAGERSFRSFLETLMLEVAPRIEPPPAYKPPKVERDTSNETLLQLWSDWHAYETVKSERVFKLNQYDGPTMARRVKTLVDSSLSIKNRMERGGWLFKRLVVGCNGDFVSGTIHEVERHSDAPSVIHAVYGTGLTLAAALRDLSPHFETIDVYCTSGNHGRLPDARRMQQKDPARNWDTAIYLYAKTALRDCPNIKFHIPESYAVLYTIEGHNFLQTHGHDIKSWNSIPYYGIDRYGRNINALLTANAMPIHYFMISHFHSLGGTPAAGGETFINGSLIGGTEFSVNALGKSDLPKQWMFGVHRKYGVASRWPIIAEGGEESYPAFPWEDN